VPIYEFYCEECHRISIFSRRVNVETIPTCPRCNKVKLKRQMSLLPIFREKEKVITQRIPLPLLTNRA